LNARRYQRAVVRRGRSKLARLWTQFPGEIVGDELAAWIIRLAKDPATRTMLEIGAGAGDGSTRQFVAGADAQDDPPLLFCVETVESRVAELRQRYADKPYVHAYRMSSAGPDDYVSIEDAIAFNSAIGVPRGDVGIPQLRVAYDYERRALDESGIGTDVVAQIRRDHGIDTFDVVLLDGSQFTGVHDLAEVYGARWLLLDDTLTLKNLQNCLALLADPHYRLAAANPRVRNGFAVFERVD